MDVIAKIGQEPHLVGLATIGGLSSLFLLSVPLVKFLASRKERLSFSFRRGRLRRAKSLAKQFRLARRQKRLGFSNIAILSLDIRRMFNQFIWLIFCIIMILMNFILSGKDKAITPGVILIVLYLALGAAAVAKFRRQFVEAMDKIAYSELPSHYWQDFKDNEINHIRRMWWP